MVFTYILIDFALMGNGHPFTNIKKLDFIGCRVRGMFNPQFKLPQPSFLSQLPPAPLYVFFAAAAQFFQKTGHPTNARRIVP